MIKEVLTYEVKVTLEDDSNEPFTAQSLDQASSMIQDYLRNLIDNKTIDDEKFWTDMNVEVKETY